MIKLKSSTWLIITVFPLLALTCVKTHPTIKFVNTSNEVITIDSISNNNLWSESIGLKIPKGSTSFYLFKTPIKEIMKSSTKNFKLYYSADSVNKVIELKKHKLKAFRTKKLKIK